PSPPPRSVTVPATANIFGAGLTTPPDPGGGGGGTPPVMIVLPPGTEYITFPGVSETVSTVSTDPSSASPADGSTGFFLNISSFGGVSGNGPSTKVFPLTGVFLDDTEPVDPAPDRLVFDESTAALESFSPLLRQTFFIGDGLTGTGSGTIQKFYVPARATRLFLGFQDASFGMGQPGYYDDNG